MYTTNTDIDCKNNMFEYHDIIWTIGKPISASLLTLTKEVHANASSVHSDLGGREDGHLGLVNTPEVYTILAPEAEAYIQLENSSRLQLDNGWSQYQIVQQRNEYVEATRVFREVLAVDRALQQQIVAAIEPKYLQALCRPDTNKINRKQFPRILIPAPDIQRCYSPRSVQIVSKSGKHYNTSWRTSGYYFRWNRQFGHDFDFVNAPISEHQKTKMAYIFSEIHDVQINTYMMGWRTSRATDMGGLQGILPPGRYGKLYKFPVSQILNSNIYLIKFYLDNYWILILEKLI